ncbi:MAG: ECF transporter S component [Clostridia bacterium]|nr:ECF transporter S component [Clostridia bacterium]
MERTQTNERTRKMVVTGMLAAVAFCAVLLGRVIPNFNGFLSYDPKDAVVAIGGFIYGPGVALIITVLVSLIELFTISTTGIYGFIMNVVSTASFALPAVIVYKKMHSMKGAYVGAAAGIVSMTAMMMLWNLIITPIYMGMPRSVVAGMMFTVFMPFNLVKSGINAGLTLLLYKPLVTALRSAKLIPEAKAGSQKFKWGYMLVSAAILSAFIAGFVMLVKPKAKEEPKEEPAAVTETVATEAPAAN